MPGLNENPQYKKFINARDAQLEVFHNKAQRQVSDYLRSAFERALLLIQSRHAALCDTENKYRLPQILKATDQDLEQIFDTIIADLEIVIKDMRRNSYVMSNAGEVEAIGRALGREKVAKIDADVALKQEDKDAEAGGHLIIRIKMYMDRQRRKLMDAVQLGSTLCHDQKTFMTKVAAQLPTQKTYKRPPKNLKTVKEADFDKLANLGFGLGRGRGTPVGGVSMTTGLINESIWEIMVEDYLAEYVPKFRDPKLTVNMADAADRILSPSGIPPVSEETWYSWELERDISQEFVQSVRDGQIDAAKENGITEFVWVSILDNKTDECCVWRDGLTTSEIEAKLSGGKSGDKCKAVVPPAHFNCRCTLAGVTDELPDKTQVALGDFESWLKNE